MHSNLYPRRSFSPGINWDYMELLKHCVTKHDKSLALYSHKHGVFRVNCKNALSCEGVRQFVRARD